MERIVGKKSAVIDPNRGIHGAINRLANALTSHAGGERTAAEIQRTMRAAQIKTFSRLGEGHDQTNVLGGSGNTRRTMAVLDNDAGRGERQ